MTDLRNYAWQVTVIEAGQPAVRDIDCASYTTTDEKQPGWTVLKDANHKIVYQVRDDMVIDMRRGDPVS